MIKRPRKLIYHIVLWVISLIFFSPVLLVITDSFKTKEQILSIPPKWFFTPTIKNFIDLFTRPNISRYFFDSIVISTTSVIIAIIVSILAAYSFSRFKPKGTDLFMFFLLSIRMVPAAASVIPVFLMYIALGWKDTWGGMILFYAMFSIPFSVWILKGFMDGLSVHYDETALVNGGSRFHIIFKVLMPQLKPGLIAAFIFNVIFVWNEFLFNYIIGGKKTTMIPVALSTWMYSQSGIDWTFVATLTTVYMIPLILAVYFFQKYLLIGMTFGTIRGEV
ncbi:MAG: carbohydrate ABC transporter permease [Spirochaetes bacterium]|nr:MAG: carbohydrate ABC transporter permease [Spirochaetota bacterium]